MNETQKQKLQKKTQKILDDLQEETGVDRAVLVVQPDSNEAGLLTTKGVNKAQALNFLFDSLAGVLEQARQDPEFQVDIKKAKQAMKDAIDDL